MIDTQNTSALQTCIDTPSSSIKPDARVAYTKGLVLGVDEFVQEQQYFLQKDYLHNRSLHGYGTVYGLAVSVSNSERDTPPAPINVAEDIWLRVSPGVGVDQGGRTFVLREPYCINFTQWWAAYTGKDKVTRSSDGKYALLYIRARYDERCDDLVAIAGQACSTDDMTSANSRIYDSVILELNPVIPTMSAWDLSQRFAWLMSQIRFVPAVVFDDVSKDALVSYVKNWLGEDSFNTKLNIELDIVEKRTGHRYFEFPERGYDTDELLKALNKAFVTNVAPKGYHNADDPYSKLEDADYDVLLAAILLGGTDNNSSITSVDTDESQRPYLLGTQTLQELLNLNKHDKNRRRIFADLHVQTPTSLLLWIHQKLKLPAELGVHKTNPPTAGANNTVVLTSNGRELAGHITLVAGTDGVYQIDITPDNDTNLIRAGERVQCVFNLDQLKDDAGKSLDVSLFNEYVGLSEDGNVLTIYTIADNLPVVLSLADANVHQDDTGLILDLGFNIGKVVTFPATAVQILKGGTALSVTAEPKNGNQVFSHFKLPGTVQNTDLLIVHIDTTNMTIDGDLLSQLMSDNQYTVVGYDGSQYVDLPCVVDAIKPYTDRDVIYVLDKELPGRLNARINEFEQKINLDGLLTLPFATITPSLVTLAPAEKGFTQLQFEVWLHTSLQVSAYSEILSLDTTNVELFAERAGVTTSISFDISTLSGYNNTFQVSVNPNLPDKPTPQDLDFTHLRFVFLIEKITAKPSGDSLKKIIQHNNIKFEGNYISSSKGEDAIVVYVRNQFAPNPPPKAQPAINKLAAAAPKAQAAAEEEAVAAPVKATPKPRTRRAGGKS